MTLASTQIIYVPSGLHPATEVTSYRCEARLRGVTVVNLFSRRYTAGLGTWNEVVRNQPLIRQDCACRSGLMAYRQLPVTAQNV